MELFGKLQKIKKYYISFIIGIAIGVIICIIAFLTAKYAVISLGAIIIFPCCFGVYKTGYTYNKLKEYNAVITEITEKNRRTVEDIAVAVRKDKSVTRGIINDCIKSRYLNGYAFMGDNVFEEKELQNVVEKSGKKIFVIRCPRCGAAIECAENTMSICEYCGNKVSL